MSSSSSSSLSLDYMTLLVTQLQNQSPLDPMDTSGITSQLAQLSQLEQLENLNTSFSSVLESTQRNYAASLIGKEVSYSSDAADGTTETLTGQVSGIVLSADDIRLVVGDKTVNMNDVTVVQ